MQGIKHVCRYLVMVFMFAFSLLFSLKNNCPGSDVSRRFHFALFSALDGKLEKNRTQDNICMILTALEPRSGGT